MQANQYIMFMSAAKAGNRSALAQRNAMSSSQYMLYKYYEQSSQTDACTCIQSSATQTYIKIYVISIRSFLVYVYMLDVEMASGVIRLGTSICRGFFGAGGHGILIKTHARH